MIRILFMSDLHLEMERWRLPVPGWPAFLARHKSVVSHPSRGPMLDEAGPVDLVVLAGDIHNGLRGLVYADQVARYLRAPVVFVAGNHEFYHYPIHRLLPSLRTAAAHTEGRVHFLDNAIASFTFHNQRLHVLGCTLWTDYDLHGDPPTAMRDAERRMKDHILIQEQSGIFLPEDALARHQTSRLWLHKTLASLRKTDPAAKTLIVTHHAPGAAYLGTRTGDIGPAYASDLLVEFAPLAPAAWIHGHTHYRHDSMEEGIRVVSAPRGYVTYDGALALEYRPGILEI
jgi:predicted MPP superfamily phosphohydrolase